MSIAKAVSSLLEPEFTAYQDGTKIPTEEAVAALEEEYGVGGSQNGQGIQYYLVEASIGIVQDVTETPATFPAVKCTYMSADGLIVTDTIRAEPTESGELDPVTGLVPRGVAPRNEGTAASTEEWESYAPILKSAHGVAPAE